MKILVTGGAGFIGSHLVDRLVTEGNLVTVVDDLSSGSPNYVNSEATFCKLDIRSPELESVFISGGFDCIFHLAAQASVQQSLKDPFRDASVNTLGSLNTFDFCRRYSVRKVVYLSSCAVYGEPKTLPVAESHVVDPISLYGVSKYVGECYLSFFGRYYEQDGTLLRLANVFGPRQRVGVISKFARLLLEGRPVMVFGDGLASRDFVYVDDVVDACVRAMFVRTTGPLNIGSGVSVSMNELIALLEQLFSMHIDVVYESPRLGDILKMRLLCDLAEKKLGWRPSVSLEEGIRKTIDYERGRVKDFGKISI